ncbi:MAG: GDSL family lipase [Clostridiales bacterium]|nr:GDSL family lipase [Clostridiales bacterium]
MKLSKNDRIVMIGDSVTDCGRARPVGERYGMGSGYPAIFASLLDIRHTDLYIRVSNTGISGNTSRHLVERWQSDVLDLNPDWVTIMIGINDVWRQLDEPKNKEIHVLEPEFEANLTKMVEDTLPHVKGMVLLPPVYMDTNKNDTMRAMRDRYAEIVYKVANKYNLPVADAQPAFDKYFEYHHPKYMAGDYVHPDLTGHIMIAEALMSALED